MPIEEKIKLYEELHPQGKKFPPNKKPAEREEDLQWLDKKLIEFGAMKGAEASSSEVQTPNSEAVKDVTETVAENNDVTIKTTSQKKVYTVAQLNHMSFDEHAVALKEIEEGRAVAVFR